jgi:hypothetical protein
MNILLYVIVGNRAGERLRTVIETIVPAKNMKIYQRIETLAQRLRGPRHDLAVIVLLAANNGDIMEFFSISDLLYDLRIILILPDRKRDTISKGHLLRPRYLAYADSNFSDVAAVLSKMLQNKYAERKNSKNKRGVLR